MTKREQPQPGHPEQPAEGGFAQIRTVGKRKHRRVKPVVEQATTAAAVAEQAEQVEQVEPAAVAAAHATSEAAQAQPEPVATSAPSERATEREMRLRNEIGDAEAQRRSLVAEMASLALGCEAEEPIALARRAELRAALLPVSDRLSDKIAALAAVHPLAEAERLADRQDRASRAVADAGVFIDRAEAWAARIDHHVNGLAVALDQLQRAQADMVSRLGRVAPVDRLWSWELPANALEDLILARLVTLGAFAPAHRPGLAVLGNQAVAEALRSHMMDLRQRIRTVVQDAGRPPQAEPTFPAPVDRVSIHPMRDQSLADVLAGAV